MAIFFARILIILLALAGFLIASYISNKKKRKEKTVCPMRGANCETVIHSRYSRIFFIPVETLGMIYYAFISISYGLVALSGTNIPIVLYGLFCVSLCSAFFSLYLVLVQALVIKHWCLWCLCSALISVSIFALSYGQFVF